MEKIFEAIIQSIGKHEDVVLATMIESIGATPRSSGTKMLIHRDHSIVGTIGGGKLEANAIQSADEVFEARCSKLFEYSLTGKEASAFDMVCGGLGEVLLSFISGSDPSLSEVFRKAIAAISGQGKGWLITQYSKENFSRQSSDFCFITEEKDIIGNLFLKEETLKTIFQSEQPTLLLRNPDSSEIIFADKVQKKNTAFIFGGGHVAKDTAFLADFVGFQTVVLDDRAEFSNQERFPNCQVLTVKSYTDLPNLPIDNQSFVIIVTRGHLGDYDVLKQVLRTDAFYIGMIGSKNKRDLIYERLRKEGIDEEQIKRIHSPIGLPIHGETPAEIAVSIIAEMILARSRKESLPEYLRR
jgi:xanthine dehydrogenase accessory factor